MKKLSTGRLVVLSSLFVTIAVLFLFIADNYKDKADFVLINRESLIEDMKHQMSMSDSSLLLYEISNQEDIGELASAVESLKKAVGNSFIIPQLFPKYTRYKDIEKRWRNSALVSLILSIITNAVAIGKKETTEKMPTSRNKGQQKKQVKVLLLVLN